MGNPDEPAAALVALGWDGNELDDVLAPFETDEARLVVVAWLAATALVRQLLAEVAIATDRISEIVGAVREYTFLDRAPLQRIDVTAGIENTLVILRSRWKAGIAIERSYAPGLPSIEAFGSELNQVWTNLLANAIDAMEGRGTIRISVHGATGDGVVVDICDSGPGIPAEVRPRIFDPFYTTKEVGRGTGLGLHISRSIVQRHGGEIALVADPPGGTCFRVSLPSHPPAPEGPADAGAAPADAGAAPAAG